jgi:hypothetical protein
MKERMFWSGQDFDWPQVRSKILSRLLKKFLEKFVSRTHDEFTA